MSDLTLPQNDKGYNLNFTITEDDGTVVDLTAYTVTLKVWRAGYPLTLIINKACTVDVAASGTCHYTIEADVLADMDELKFDLVLTKTGVIMSSKKYDLTVEESG
jgi:hypothetical protein